MKLAAAVFRFATIPMRRKSCLCAVVLAGVFVPAVGAGAGSEPLVVFSSFLPEYPLPDNFGVERTFVVQGPGTSLELALSDIVSPDGRRVASVHASEELWISPVAGGGGQRIVTAAAPIGDVSWSNDGSRLSFVSGGDVWVVDADGLELHQVFLGHGSAGSATWAPDDAHLLVVAGAAWLVAADGSTQRPIFEPATSPAWADEGIWDIAWAPKTGALALTIGTAAGCGPGIYKDCYDWYAETFDRSGNRLGRVGSALNVAWSPDGKRIAFESGLFSLEPDQVDVEVASADGSAARSVTQRVRKRAKDDCWQYPQWLDSTTVVVEETFACQSHDEDYPEVGFDVIRNRHLVWRSIGRNETVDPVAARIAFLRRLRGHSALFTADFSRVSARVTEVAGSAGAPTWSSNGRSLAFPVVGTRFRDLYVLTTGAGQRRVARLPLDRTLAPLWYGSRLFYSSQLPLSPRALLWVVRPDGSGLRRLTGPSGAVDPSWSPDGSRIAFAYPTSIATTGAHGGSIRRIVAGTQKWYMNPSWSADGRQLVYTRTSYGIYIVGSKGGASRVLVKGGDYLGTSSQAWSPDGKTIAYWNAGDIDVINADGTGARTLLSCGCGAPAWSPDGSKLAFSCYSCSGRPGIVVANADGSGVHVLVANSEGDLGGYPDLEAPAWSPDGSRLVFSGTSCVPAAAGADQSAVPPAICVIATDGTGLRALTPPGVGAYAPSWRPSS